MGGEWAARVAGSKALRAVAQRPELAAAFLLHPVEAAGGHVTRDEFALFALAVRG